MLINKTLKIILAFLCVSCSSLAANAEQACWADPEVKTKINVKKFGAVGDGRVDDTAAIQKAFDVGTRNGEVIFIPEGVYMIDAVKGLRLRGDLNVLMDPNATLMALANSASNYNVLLIEKVSNVRITGGNVVGERNEHQGTSGEWGMGIKISNGSNIRIKNMLVRDAWGDGLYINKESKNISLCKIISTNNRRQGLSIISASDVDVTYSTFERTQGTNPQAGVDIEPNKGDFVRKVTITNSEFFDNAGPGFLIHDPQNNVSEVRFYKNIIKRNANRGVVIDANNAIIERNTFYENRPGVAVFTKSSKDNVFRGNDLLGVGLVQNFGQNYIENN